MKRRNKRTNATTRKGTWRFYGAQLDKAISEHEEARRTIDELINELRYAIKSLGIQTCDNLANALRDKLEEEVDSTFREHIETITNEEEMLKYLQADIA